MTRTQEGSRFFSPIYIDDASSEPVVVLAVPVTDIFGDYQGTLVSELNLKFMWDLVGGIEVGESGYAYVVDDLGNLIAFQDSARVLRGENLAAISEVQEFVSDPSETSDELTSGVTAYIGLNAARVVGTHLALGTPRWAVVIEQPWDEAYRPIIVLAAWGLIIILGVMIVSGLVSIPVSRILSAPLVDLSGVAEQVASGNLTLQAKAAGPLEIRRVATTFNDMTSRLRELIGTLEERVADRTRALAASAEVSRRLSTILDQSQLVVEVVDQVQRAFGYYHAHIYLVDEATGDLVMAGGTGEAGKIMLARGHRIPKGKGLVGRAAETGAPVLAADVTSDPDWLSNPLLPETRSEAAVPISLGAQTVGVLDVQQNVAGGLEQADIDLLQSIANQVAIAVQNARTYTEVRRQAEREALIARIGAQIQSATRVDEALKVAVREVGRALGTQATVRLAGHPGEDGRKRAAGRRKADR
jgi:putative methionine-R-sulfoxide reductase with GAF domain